MSRRPQRAFDPPRFNPRVFAYYERLDRVREYVEGNLDVPIHLTDAARVANLSPSYFSTFFREKTGIPFGQWVTQLRIERAKRRLTERNLQITEVAYESGFRDLRTFQRAFKRYTGETARSFKNGARPD